MNKVSEYIYVYIEKPTDTNNLDKLYKITEMLLEVGRYPIQALKSTRSGSLSHSGAGREGFNPGQPINGKREDLVSLFPRR